MHEHPVPVPIALDKPAVDGFQVATATFIVRGGAKAATRGRRARVDLLPASVMVIFPQPGSAG